jgi:hypothetical protein
MNEKLDMSGIENPNPQNNKDFAPIIPLGVDEFTVNDIETGESSQKKTPFLRVHFLNNDKIPFREDFWLSPKALPRLKEFLIACEVPEEVAGSSNVSVEEIRSNILNKTVRLIVGGEEFLTKENKVRIRRNLPFKFFCESTKIPRDKSRLSYDEKWHLKRLDVGNAESTTTNDLPF